MSIPVIDIFAGPGGLGEGFSVPIQGRKVFKVVLSIEMDKNAYETLKLRSFYRQFSPDDVPDEYYQFLRGDISKSQLYKFWPKQYKQTREEAWNVKLGESKDCEPDDNIDIRIKKALNGSKNWVLIGGPPCQAYSVVGRSRRSQSVLNPKEDERVDLYKQYLRLLAVHNPPVFVMENVKGLLSAKTKDSAIFSKILNDLSDPKIAYKTDFKQNGKKIDCIGYNIFSLVVESDIKQNNQQFDFEPSDFVIQSENFGIPQTRHRVILLGLRKDIKTIPETLEKKEKISIEKVIDDLPRVRSTLSRQEDNWQNWKHTLEAIMTDHHLKEFDDSFISVLTKTLKNLRKPQKGSGGEFLEKRSNSKSIKYEKEWFLDDKLGGVCNHQVRAHMNSDLLRYFFSSLFAKEKKRSPKLEDFPRSLLPNHQNVEESLKTKKFTDRFRVQLKGTPAKTITSHIAKDGHYYIHYDPTQCRSLTVREAARIQTFPDNYFFCGPRTSQYTQVGNAVPPLLAHKISKIINRVFQKKNYAKPFRKVTAKV